MGAICHLHPLLRKCADQLKDPSIGILAWVLEFSDPVGSKSDVCVVWAGEPREYFGADFRIIRNCYPELTKMIGIPALYSALQRGAEIVVFRGNRENAEAVQSTLSKISPDDPFYLTSRTPVDIIQSPTGV